MRIKLTVECSRDGVKEFEARGRVANLCCSAASIVHHNQALLPSFSLHVNRCNRTFFRRKCSEENSPQPPKRRRYYWHQLRMRTALLNRTMPVHSTKTSVSGQLFEASVCWIVVLWRFLQRYNGIFGRKNSFCDRSLKVLFISLHPEIFWITVLCLESCSGLNDSVKNFFFPQEFTDSIECASDSWISEFHLLGVK